MKRFIELSKSSRVKSHNKRFNRCAVWLQLKEIARTKGLSAQRLSRWT